MSRLSYEEQEELFERLIRTMRDNPDLKVIPMVDGEVVEYDGGGRYWLGSWESVDIEEVYIGRRFFHFKWEEDEEDVLFDLFGYKHGDAPGGRRIEEMTEEEQKDLYDSLPWKKVITVCIGTI